MAIWATIGGAVRGVLKTIARALGRWMIWQVVWWISSVGVAWTIQRLKTKIRAALEKYNRRVMAKVREVEDFIYGQEMPRILEEMEGRIGVMVATIEWAGRIQSIVSAVTNSAGESVEVSVRTTVGPALDQLREIQDRLEGEGCAGFFPDLVLLETRLTNLPAEARDSFMVNYPGILSANLENELIEMVTDVLAEKLADFLSETRTKMRRSKSKGLITKKIGEEITNAEMEFIESLPFFLEPVLAELVEMIKERMEAAQNEVMGDLDELYIASDAVERILKRMQERPAGNNPLRFDSIPWTLDDIYRMLVNYFYRYERMALAFIIASQDMGIDADELKEIMLELDER